MKKYLIILFFVASGLFAQDGFFVPMLWKLNGTDLVPTNATYRVPVTYLTITKSDIGLGNVTNNAQIIKAASSTNGVLPKWKGTSGDSIVDGYTVGTGANNLVQLDGSGRLPAVSGALLTGLPAGTAIIKVSNESISNDTTFQDDNDFSFSVAANATYYVYAFISATSKNSGTLGGLKMQFTAPAGATVTSYGGSVGRTQAATTITTTYSTNGKNLGFYNSAMPFFVFITAKVVTGATAGNLVFQWTQEVADVTATTLYAGSYMMLTKP